MPTAAAAHPRRHRRAGSFARERLVVPPNGRSALSLGRGTESALQLAHLVPALAPSGGSWVQSCRPCPRAWLLLRRDHPRGFFLPPRCSARRSFARLAPPSSVQGAPRTSAAQRPISPLAYATRLAPARAAQTGLPNSALLLSHVPRPLPRRDRRRASEQAPPMLPSPGHDRLGSRIVHVTRLQASLQGPSRNPAPCNRPRRPDRWTG